MSLSPVRSPSADLLAKMAPNFHAFDFIKSYAAIQIVARLVETKGWKYPHAAFKNAENAPLICERLNITWPLAFLDAEQFSDEFSSIYSLIQPLTLREFLREFLPDFATQIAKTFDVLDALETDIETKCLALLLAKKEWLRETGEDFPVETYERRVRRCLNDEQWQKLVYAVNCYAFSYKSKILKAANDAHKVFSKYHCTPEYQIALYGQIREKLVKSWEGRDTNWSKFITDGAHYIRKINGGDPQIDLLGMDEAINTAAESIGKIKKPTDFLEAVLVNESNDDSKIENDFVYSKFVERLVPGDRVLIINPSPDFLCQYPKEFLSQTTFCVPSQPMVWVLRHEFHATFIPFSDFIGYASYPSHIRDIKLCRYCSKSDLRICHYIRILNIPIFGNSLFKR